MKPARQAEPVHVTFINTNMTSFQTFVPYYMSAVTILDFANAIWAFRDARLRGRSGILISLLVFWSFPVGVILWLYLRPELLSERPQDRGTTDPDADIKAQANAGIL